MKKSVKDNYEHQVKGKVYLHVHTICYENGTVDIEHMEPIGITWTELLIATGGIDIQDVYNSATGRCVEIWERMEDRVTDMKQED